MRLAPGPLESCSTRPAPTGFGVDSGGTRTRQGGQRMASRDGEAWPRDTQVFWLGSSRAGGRPVPRQIRQPPSPERAAESAAQAARIALRLRERASAAVRHAADGADALARIAEARPDLVLGDADDGPPRAHLLGQSAAAHRIGPLRPRRPAGGRVVRQKQHVSPRARLPPRHPAERAGWASTLPRRGLVGWTPEVRDARTARPPIRGPARALDEETPRWRTAGSRS
jgi:hypothetical protein